MKFRRNTMHNRVRIRCPRCGKRLTDIEPLIGDDGLVALADLSSTTVGELSDGTMVARASGSGTFGQPGRRTGWVQPQSFDGVFESGVWRWHCRCGVKRNVRNEVLRQYVADALTRGERDVRLP